MTSPPSIKLVDEYRDDLVPKMPDLEEERIKIRKKSPEELVATVNRKYNQLFGQDLVNLMPSKDTSMMDVEDFMRYLKGGNQEIKKSLPLRNPSPQRLAYIEGIKSQAEVNRKKKFDASPKRVRSKSQKRRSVDVKKVRFNISKSAKSLNIEIKQSDDKNKDCQKMLVDIYKGIKK